MRKIGIIDYDVGNFFSLENALKELNVDYIISNKEKYLDKCSHIVLPGVGAFLPAMRSLKKYKMDKFIYKANLEKKFILGICLGMQLLLDSSNEHSVNKGLSLIKGKVKKIENKNLKTPIIGWYKMNTKSNSFLKNFNNKYGYLVHSYECIPENENNIIGTYKILDKKVVCAVQNNNVIGLQFHPEKSDYQGIKIFKNFLDM